MYLRSNNSLSTKDLKLTQPVLFVENLRPFQTFRVPVLHMTICNLSLSPLVHLIFEYKKKTSEDQVIDFVNYFL